MGRTNLIAAIMPLYTNKIVALIIVSMICYSCSVYKLTSKDLEWQPYKVGDSLIFESSKGELDTVKITSIEKYTNPDDPLSLWPRINQILFVNSNDEILELSANKHGSFIAFKLRLGNNKLKYPITVQKIDSIQSNPTENGTYRIEAKEYYDNMKGRKVDLRYIYWSKKYGYTKLEFKDGYNWVLKYFYRNGENIF